MRTDMGLTNAQYDEIMREYERRRLNHRAEAQTRHTQIVRQIPEIAALEEERATISAAHARRLLSGEAVTGASLHEALTALSDRRATLLAQHGYPADYLDPIVDCPDCQDTGYVHGEKCHCLKQRIISCRYEQAGIQGLMSDVSFDRFFDKYDTEILRLDAAVVAEELKKAQALEKQMEREFALYNAVERLAAELIAKKRRIYKGVSANIDFYSGFCYSMLGLPLELYTPLFAAARMTGWSAHRIEELVNANKIIRPAYLNVHPRTDYIPLSERK